MVRDYICILRYYMMVRRWNEIRSCGLYGRRLVLLVLKMEKKSDKITGIVWSSATLVSRAKHLCNATRTRRPFLGEDAPSNSIFKKVGWQIQTWQREPESLWKTAPFQLGLGRPHRDSQILSVFPISISRLEAANWLWFNYL